MFTLPREYRPINLRTNDKVLQKKHNSDKGSTICSTSTGASSTFVHPTLPEIPNNIITHISIQLDFSSIKTLKRYII